MLPDHRLTPFITAYECDNTEGYAQCSCGWESRTVKANWIDEKFAEHLAEAAEQHLAEAER